MSTTNTQPKKRVLIVGAGASGMAAAYACSKAPDRFDVTLLERSSYCGGMATSVEIDPEVYGASYMNDGVQGASPAFQNTFKLFMELGFESTEVGMQCSFGKGDDFWSNTFPSETIDKYKEDIVKFGKVLNIIKALEPFFALMSVQATLSLFRFKKEFGEVIVFPLVALFFGTGNQTPYVSTAILGRVFTDPSMRLFEYSPTSFLASIPSMRAFPRLSLLYSTWATLIESTSAVKILTSHEVTSVLRSSSCVKVTYRETEGTNLEQNVVGGKEEVEGTFDEIVFACDADAAVKLLGKGASWLEKKALGNVKYLSDVSITHSDVEYMNKYYTTTFSSDLQSKTRENDKEAQDQFKFAEKNFEPLYYIRSYPGDKKKIEMSFDLTNYQPQFKGYTPEGKAPSPLSPSDNPSSDSLETKTPQPAPKEFKHVFQTIFLDRDGSEDLWSRGDIKEEEIILTKWWKQQSHRWQHYGGTVPFMMLINGRNRTHFAGAWSILNMHEIALVSGFAAAYTLGAPYPFRTDEGCKRLFALYLGASHAKRLRGEDRKGFFF